MSERLTVALFLAVCCVLGLLLCSCINGFDEISPKDLIIKRYDVKFRTNSKKPKCFKWMDMYYYVTGDNKQFHRRRDAIKHQKYNL